MRRASKILVLIISFLSIIGCFALFIFNSKSHCRVSSSSFQDSICKPALFPSCQGTFGVSQEVLFEGKTFKVSRTCPWSQYTVFFCCACLLFAEIFVVSLMWSLMENKIFCTDVAAMVSLPCLLGGFALAIRDIIEGVKHYKDLSDNWNYNSFLFILPILILIYLILIEIWGLRVVLRLSNEKLACLRFVFRVPKEDDYPAGRISTNSSQIVPQLNTLQDQSSNITISEPA